MWFLSLLYQALSLSSYDSFFPFSVTRGIFTRKKMLVAHLPEPQNSGHEPGLVVFLQPPDTHIEPPGKRGGRESPGEQGALWFGWCPAGGARELLSASLTRAISSSRQAGGPTDTCTAFCGVFIFQNCVVLEAHHSSCHFCSWSQKRPQNLNLRKKMKKKGIFHLNFRYLCYRMFASWLLKAAEFVLGFSPGKRGIPGQHLYFYFPPHWGKG